MATNEEIMLAVGNLQGSVIATTKSIDKLGYFMGAQNDKLSELKADVAVIKQTQSDMKEGMTTYTGDCTRDRSSQDKRLTSVEGYQARQLKMAALIGTVMGAVASLGVEWFKK